MACEFLLYFCGYDLTEARTNFFHFKMTTEANGKVVCRVILENHNFEFSILKPTFALPPFTPGNNKN